MGVEFTVEHSRTAIYLFDPKLIRVPAALNGRTDLPDIEGIIASIVSVGQLEPVEIRSEGGKPVLSLGFSRWRALIEINKRKLIPGGMKLRCVYARRTEREGFVANIHENVFRNQLSNLDHANNMRQLELWGKSHEEIAETYRRFNKQGEPDVRWVRDTVALATLGEEARGALRSGKLKLPAARAIAKLSEEQQRERLASGELNAPAKPRTPKAAGAGALVVERVSVDTVRMSADLDAHKNALATIGRGLEAVDGGSVLLEDFKEWLAEVVKDLGDGINPTCWHCSMAVHVGPCYQDAEATQAVAS